MSKRLGMIRAIACGAVLTLCAGSWAADAAGLGDASEAKRLDSVKQFVAEKAGAITTLLKVLDGKDVTAAKMAGQALFEIVQKAAGGPDAQAVADVLAGELAGSHETATKQQTCASLGYCAGKKVVDALAAAMDVPAIGEDARRALVRVRDGEATAVLMTRLAKADEKAKVALIDGLGQKGDAAAIPVLVEQTSAAPEAIRAAAWNALATIPSDEAVPAFTKAVADKNAVAIGELLDYATTLLDAGMLAPAETVIKLRVDAGPLSDLDRCKLLRAHGRLGTPDSIEYVLAALDEQNHRIRAAALESAVLLPGVDVSRLITERMLKAKGPARIELLEVLGRRGAQLDDRTVMMMYMAMLDPDDAVKIACIRAMQAAEVTSTVPTLINFVRGQNGPVADAAEQALARIPDDSVTVEIVRALPQSAPAGRVRLLQILGQRGGDAAIAALTQAAGDSDVSVRAAAYTAMVATRNESIYDTLLTAFESNPGPDRDAAERAMMSLKGDVITAKLLAAYFDASDHQKPSLLRVLAPRQLDTIDALMRSEAVSSDEAIREAAVKGLCQRANPAMAPVLLAAAKAGPEKIASTAISGYLQMAAVVEGKDKAVSAQMYADALKLAKSDDQKKDALLGLSRVGDPSAAGVLDGAAALMKEPKLQAPAAMAVAGLASRMPAAQKDKAVELLDAAMKVSNDRGLQTTAIAGLRGFGVKIDPAHEQGFITCWWLAGPFARGGNTDWDSFSPSLAQPDISKPAKIVGQDRAFKKMYSSDPQGAVDLITVYGPSNNVAAFACAQVECDSAVEATFKVGSDDGIAVWVNGQKVHANNAFRMLTPDQDVFKASLKAGRNDIVVKAVQARDGWSYCMRLVGPDGKPLVLKQRTE